jgi:DeoR/GlpR family transcriptional regulator of sugar metabolism
LESKFNKVLTFTFGNHLSDLDILICDENIPENIAAKAREAGVKML